MPIRRSPHNPYTYKAPANNWPWRSLFLAGLFVFGYVILEASTARSNGAASSSGYLAEQALRRTSQHLADAVHEADDDHLLREGATGVRASARRAKLKLKRPSARKVRKGWQPEAQAERGEQGGASSSTKRGDDDDKAGAAAASTATTKLRGEGARAAMLEKATALERATHKIIADKREQKQKQAVVTTTTAAAVPGATDSAATETAANTAASGRTSRPRGALIYLVSPDRNQPSWEFEKDAILSVICALRFYARSRKYPVLVFHTLDQTQRPAFKAALEEAGATVDDDSGGGAGGGGSGAAGAQVRLIQVQFRYPEGISDAYLAAGRCTLCGVDYFPKGMCGCTCPDLGCKRNDGDTHCWSINYLHMNHFFTYLMWLQPALAHFDYFMRIDADLYIQNELPYDPFERLQRHGCAFGTGKESSDMIGCYEGQRTATLEWAKAQHASGTAHAAKVSVANVENARDNSVYWGGFHVGDVNFFRQKAHLDYAKHMNELGGMYTHRWSDQLHYPLAVQMLNEKYDMHESGEEDQGEDQGKRTLCLMPELFDPGKAVCHGEKEVKMPWGTQRASYCEPGSSTDIFLHEHRLGTRKDLWERCSLH